MSLRKLAQDIKNVLAKVSEELDWHDLYVERIFDVEYVVPEKRGLLAPRIVGDVPRVVLRSGDELLTIIKHGTGFLVQDPSRLLYRPRFRGTVTDAREFLLEEIANQIARRLEVQAQDILSWEELMILDGNPKWDVDPTGRVKGTLGCGLVRQYPSFSDRYEAWDIASYSAFLKFVDLDDGTPTLSVRWQIPAGAREALGLSEEWEEDRDYGFVRSRNAEVSDILKEAIYS